MEERGKQGAQPYDKKVSINHNSSVNEEEITKQHQYQMFPTPDEKASGVITRMKD